MFYHIYGDAAVTQLLGWFLVFMGLILLNEIARRSKAGGIFCFIVVPAALTVYFAAIAIGVQNGAEWALNNPTYLHMNGWFHYAKLYAATIGCIGFMLLKYKWGIGKTDWFKVFPFLIVAINILIAVASDFESAIKGAAALRETGSAWWFSNEGVWIYGGWWNWVNGIAGIINILCMTGWWGIYQSKDKKDMLWPDMTWCYILAYDIWNFEYTYNNLPTHSWYCGHLCKYSLEQGRMDSKPRQHTRALVYVCSDRPGLYVKRQICGLSVGLSRWVCHEFRRRPRRSRPESAGYYCDSCPCG